MSTTVKKTTVKPETIKKNVSETKKSTKNSSREISTDRANTKKKKENEEALKTALKKNTTKNVPTTSSKLPENSSSKIKFKSSHDLVTKKSTSNTKIKGKDALSTPNSRVVRQPYFPSKNLYSNALKAIKSEVLTTNTTSNNNTTVTPRSTSLPKNIPNKKDPKPKKSREDSSSEASTISERPRTATLRKPSIVNANIVGPEVSKNAAFKENSKTKIKIEKPSTKIDEGVSKSPSNSDQYESDFDSYESDFEKYSSSNDSENIKSFSGEETSSISSGTGENLSKPFSPHATSMKTPTSLEYEKKLDSGTFDLGDFKYRHLLDNIKESIVQENSKIVTKNPPSLSDEGFEDQKSLQFINFADAHRKCEKNKESALRKKRGAEILSMIRLDYVNFTIFDLPAVSYDEFIKNYGNGNAVQTSVQTGEDNISEDTQTDVVEIENKWTQMPVCFKTFDQGCDNFWSLYKADYLGVGTDKRIEEDSNSKVKFEDHRLLNFLQNSVDLVLNILTEENIQNIKNLKENKRDLPFSSGYLQLNSSEDIFKETTVKNIAIYPKNANKILSVHVKTKNVEDYTSLVCCWDISNIDTPQNIYMSFGKVTCCTFSKENADYIFAAEEDGSILVWDTKISSQFYDISCKTPSFQTAVGKGHSSKVVALQSYSSQSFTSNGVFEATKSSEISSLDQDGKIIFWSMFTNYTSKTPLKLLKTDEINLVSIFPELVDMQCTDMILDKNDVYISTNYGDVLHYLIDGARCKVKKYHLDKDTAETTCLDLCPFSPAYFLSGNSNGNLNLYSKTSKKPLKVLSNRDDFDCSSVQLVQWSKTKPFVLYVKDLKNILHVWDLSKSEVYPEYSVPFSERITSLKLSPVLDFGHQGISYMIVGTENGKIYLHILNKNYGQENLEVYKNDVSIFLNYVGRL